MEKKRHDIIIIGGSAGSIPVVIDLLKALPDAIGIPVVLVIHRMRNTHSDMNIILSEKRAIREPEDKEDILPQCIYLAPQNYHLLVEEDRTFSLDYSDPVNYSRPSIDVSFVSFAHVFKERTLGILLSGANNDGAEGIREIVKEGGTAIVQDPLTAGYPAMPQAAIQLTPGVDILSPERIVHYITSHI